EAAVLETARGGILNRGLAFDKCDVAVLTNIAQDHLGLDGVETLEDLAWVKSLVIESVSPRGFAVLNADDPRCVAMAGRTRGSVIYFSLEPENLAIKRHIING